MSRKLRDLGPDDGPLTPLQMARRAGNDEIVKLLLDAGARDGGGADGNARMAAATIAARRSCIAEHS